VEGTLNERYLITPDSNIILQEVVVVGSACKVCSTAGGSSKSNGDAQQANINVQEDIIESHYHASEGQRFIWEKAFRLVLFLFYPWDNTSLYSSPDTL
jgi:hypothetical protein